eukprot:1086705-Rhodomonas_salina.1
MVRSDELLCDDTVAMAGITLTPGLYKSTSGMQLTGTLTLDGEGDEDAVWIFQMGSTFVSAVSAEIVLKNGANARNIFWQVLVLRLARPARSLLLLKSQVQHDSFGHSLCLFPRSCKMDHVKGVQPSVLSESVSRCT